MLRKTVLTVLVVFFVQGCRQPHEAEVDRLFGAFDGDVPGASVMVIRDGRPVFVKAYGLANMEKAISAKPETNFRLASVTKQFTAMAVMILVDRGQLSFDTSLRDLFSDFPYYGNSITIRQLLTHTSGLVAYESLIPDTATKQVYDRDVLRMVTCVDSTYFTPGTAYRYSNSGYAVLAMVVEKVSGATFPEFLKKNVFDPLGMKNSLAFVDGANVVLVRSFGYRPEGNGFIFSDQSLTSAVLGDGGIYTSVLDLFRWDQALYTETLVSQDMLDQAFTPAVLTNVERTTYGFGWNVGDYRGHRRVFHGGSTCGFRTVIHRYPDDRFTVIVLANRSVAKTDELAESLSDIFLMEGKN